MNEILKKLGLKNQNPILILNAPLEYRHLLQSIEAQVDEELLGTYAFIQVFSKSFDEVNSLTAKILGALQEDGFLWLCYPKGTSKIYKSDISRTKSWELFAPYDFEPVTQVSIDENWSAIRFRHVDRIKTLKRKTAASEKGKERILKS